MQMIRILPEAAGTKISAATRDQPESQSLQGLATEIAHQVNKARTEQQED